MEIVEHGLWAAAGAVVANRKWHLDLPLKWTVWWAVFPDVFAFTPIAAAVAWQQWVLGVKPERHHLPLGIPLYDLGHSLVVFALVFAVAALLLKRRARPLLGWLSHVLIDIPTHSYSYYATKFLWPISNVGVDGIPWWQPWFWVLTYATLACVYTALWRAGWLRREGLPSR